MSMDQVGVLPHPRCQSQRAAQPNLTSKVTRPPTSFGINRRTRRDSIRDYYGPGQAHYVTNGASPVMLPTRMCIGGGGAISCALEEKGVSGILRCRCPPFWPRILSSSFLSIDSATSSLHKKSPPSFFTPIQKKKKNAQGWSSHF